MTPTAFLNTFEHNPHANMANFWARSGIWRFDRWRDLDFAAMGPDDVRDLIAAMRQDAFPKDEDLERAMQDYIDRAGPREPLCACGVCGAASVPISREAARKNPSLAGPVGTCLASGSGARGCTSLVAWRSRTRRGTFKLLCLQTAPTPTGMRVGCLPDAHPSKYCSNRSHPICSVVAAHRRPPLKYSLKYVLK